MADSRRVVLGRVAGAHGVAGQVRVRWLGDGPENLLQASDLWFAQDADDPAPRHMAVVGVAGVGRGEIRFHLEGVDDREQALRWKGQFVLGDARRLGRLPADQFYWHEIIGWSVETTEGEPLGRVVEMLETGAHDVLVVESDSGRRSLIPSARQFVPEIDREEQRVVVAPIPGLLDDEEEAGEGR